MATAIGVPRSSISHLLTGRNKPSLDFILKLIKTYPEVNLYWFLNGKGDFPSVKENSTKANDLFTKNATTTSTPPIDEVSVAIDSTPDDDSSKKPLHNETIIVDNNSKSISTEAIERIVVFFKDGTFTSYNPK